MASEGTVVPPGVAFMMESFRKERLKAEAMDRLHEKALKENRARRRAARARLLLTRLGEILTRLQDLDEDEDPSYLLESLGDDINRFLGEE